VRTVRFHDAARLEFRHEVRYYTLISPALGRRLAAAVEEAVSLAASFPEIGSPYLRQTKRVFPKKFPFSTVYLSKGMEIFVVAFAPFSRKPGYWRARTDGQPEASE
jgi:plasmid stabilization system protein ParE